MNAARVDWRELFASPIGRCPRGLFWFAAGSLLVLAALYEVVVNPTVKLLTFWFVYPALLASGACVISKRLHDRGRTGWWAALVLLGVALTWREPSAARLLFALPIMVWTIVELGLLGGEQGANRFGPSPMAGAPA
jgi:uncharacterized membrane protein YhaH (DUF805 family)